MAVPDKPPPTPPLSTDPAAAVAPSRSRRHSVLLIEDNRADVIMIEEAIEIHNLPVDFHFVCDGRKAFQWIKEAESGTGGIPIPDLILLDLNLPLHSGKEVLLRLRQSEKFASIPVIIVSSSDSDAEKCDLISAGANHYFHKPPSYDGFVQLGEIVRRFLGKPEMTAAN